jgi:hypothetical protein
VRNQVMHPYKTNAPTPSMTSWIRRHLYVLSRNCMEKTYVCFTVCSNTVCRKYLENVENGVLNSDMSPMTFPPACEEQPESKSLFYMTNLRFSCTNIFHFSTIFITWKVTRIIVSLSLYSSSDNKLANKSSVTLTEWIHSGSIINIISTVVNL